MDGTLFPSRPVYPVHGSSNTRPPTHPPWKQLNPGSTSTSTSTSLPPPPPSSFPIDSLLHHLASNPHFPSLHTSLKTTSVPVPRLQQHAQPDDGHLDFLTTKGKMMFNSILQLPLHALNRFFDRTRSDLLDIDLISLLKALDLSGNWERSLLLFEWVLANLCPDVVRLNTQVIELMVRILGRESQHTIACKLFDEITLEQFSLDVRAYTTIIHAYSRTGKYGHAIAISVFERMKESGLSPTLVTYNFILDA